MNARIWIAALGLVAVSFAKADEPQPTPVSQALREIINEGADLFNQQGDYAGCYRLYQGSLMAVRPLLNREQQQRVNAALGEVPNLKTTAEKAYRLREAIDRIRSELAPPEEELLRAMPERVEDVTSR